MKFSREEYIELMTFGHVGRQMFVELFGPLIGLAEEWRAQGATQEEIDMVAFDWDFVPVIGCGGHTGARGGYLLARQDRSKKDTGIFEQKYPQRFLAEYNVIRLWEMNGEEALKNCTPGSLPFIPLMKTPDNLSREKWLSKCVSVRFAHRRLRLTVANEITPREHLPNLLFSMSILGGLVISDTDTIETIIPEEIMKESAYYQHIVNKARTEGLAEGRVEGRVEGRAEGLAEGLLALIRKRFTSVPRTILPKIKSIRDKETLFNIQTLALDAKTKKEFIETFNLLKDR